LDKFCKGGLMDSTIASGLLGLLGGSVRVLLGIMKSATLKRKIVWNYALVTMLSSGIIGALLGIIFNFDYRLAALAGYAGTDILEGIYKSFKVEKVYVKGK